jgi:Protein of unknown function (DUF2867)
MGHDYTDRFGRRTVVRAAPERWARAMFGDVPGAGEVVIWRGLLGLRLDRSRSPDTVAGWRVTGRGDDRIRLEATGRVISGVLVVRTGDDEVSLTTRVRYEHPVARLWWPPLSAVHRFLVPRVLRAADERLSMSPGRSPAHPIP